MVRTISVCDRESDLYEYLTYKQGQQQRFVVRASRNRQTEAGQQLFEALDAPAPSLGTRTVSIAQRGGRLARQARVALRAATRTLSPPRHRREAGPVLPMNVVWIQETEPPSDIEPLCWRLLTSEPIQTAEQAAVVARYYALRWRIKEYHKAWKSGVGVERQRMQYTYNLRRMITITAFVAVRLRQLREDLEPQTGDHAYRCDVMLETDEWRVLWQACEQTGLPEQPPTLVWAYRAIACLGASPTPSEQAVPDGTHYGVDGHACRACSKDIGCSLSK